MSFWQNITARIRERKTTQEWVATRAGINYRTFRGWVSLDRLPDVEAGQRIASALDTTVEFLVGTSVAQRDIWVESNYRFISDCKNLTPRDFGVVENMVHTMARMEVDKKMVTERTEEYEDGTKHG